jgi:hypothetical protein
VVFVVVTGVSVVETVHVIVYVVVVVLLVISFRWSKK